MRGSSHGMCHCTRPSTQTDKPRENGTHLSRQDNMAIVPDLKHL
jgi:hypothetical protein